MHIEEIIQWVKKYSIEKKTLEHCQDFLLSYEIEEPEDYNEMFGTLNLKELIYEIHTVSMDLKYWPECEHNTISVSMWVYNNFNNKLICRYKVLYTFDGVPDDDFFDGN